MVRVSRQPIILTYHSISHGRSPLRVAPSLFAEQMEWLRSNCHVLSLTEVVDSLVRNTVLPERTVVLTFDDAFQNFFSEAAPVLRGLGLSATVFLPTGYCGRCNGWPGQPRWVEEEPLLDWKQVVELAGQGFIFGSHSLTHPDLVELAHSDAEREIAGSKGEVEGHIGRKVEFFCYPYGRWNAAIRGIAMRYYRGACSTAAGMVLPEADPWALPRVDAHYVRHAAWFRSLFTNRFAAYLSTRRLIRRVRGQPEGFYARR